MRQSYVAVLAVFLLGAEEAQAFYLPGVQPQSFGVGDEVKLKVNKMTSLKTLEPVEYYHLPFCQPDGGPKMDNENLGEFLAGDRIETSPYRLQMQVDMYCEQVCIADLGVGDEFVKDKKPSQLVRAIRKEFHNNWIVDNLPSASIAEDDEYVTTRYSHGFPIGFVDSKSRLSYVNNHVNIMLEYHAVETEVGKNRIVRFTVEPFSIKHEFEPADMDDDDEGLSSEFKVADILNPIKSCESKKNHTDYNMITHSNHASQPASGKVLFTYDVIWKENKDLHWASRWDIYLSTGPVSPKVHWFSIANSLLIVFVLSALIAAILVRNLRRDYARYNRVATDEEKAEEMEEFGWKLVHADVFRAPSFSPMIMAVCCGSGVQLLCMSFLTLIFAAMGFLSPANRGSLIIALLLLYVFMGSIAGYTSARFFKTFKGKSWQRATTLTALFYPSIAFGVFFVMDILAMTQGSSDAVPFGTIVVLLVLWFGISTPLVFIGGYIGYKQDAMKFPVVTSNIPRQIPDQPWFMGTPLVLSVGGLLPFGACYLELFYIMSSVWLDQFYYMFGFLFLTFLIMIVTCAEVSILFTYYQLCGEDYNWWWRSFATSGSMGPYVFLYSISYFQTMETNSFATYLLFFGYMALASFTLLLMTGTVGVFSSLWFNKKIYGSIKVD